MKGLELKVQEIADRVRELRTIEGFSEEYMAQKIGVTVDEYKAYEAGNQELDFAFLYTCAQVLNVDVTELIEGITPRLSSYIMTRKGEGLRVEQAHGMTYYNLAYKFRDRVAEPLFVHSTFSADAQLKPIEVTVHEGHEFDIVINGHLKVQLGNHTEVLGPGDTIYYDSSTPHGMIATDGEDCDFYAIVLDPDRNAAAKPAAIPTIAPVVQTKKRVWEKFVEVEETASGELSAVHFKDPESFNFAFDVVDVLGSRRPEKLALLHVSNDGKESRFTFQDMAKLSSRAANYFRTLGIKKGV